MNAAAPYLVAVCDVNATRCDREIFDNLCYGPAGLGYAASRPARQGVTWRRTETARRALCGGQDRIDGLLMTALTRLAGTHSRQFYIHERNAETIWRARQEATY